VCCWNLSRINQSPVCRLAGEGRRQKGKGKWGRDCVEAAADWDASIPLAVQQAMAYMLHASLLWEWRRVHARAIIVCSRGWRHSGRGGGGGECRAFGRVVSIRDVGSMLVSEVEKVSIKGLTCHSFPGSCRDVVFRSGYRCGWWTGGSVVVVVE